MTWAKSAWQWEVSKEWTLKPEWWCLLDRANIPACKKLLKNDRRIHLTRKVGHMQIVQREKNNTGGDLKSMLK